MASDPAFLAEFAGLVACFLDADHCQKICGSSI